MPPSQPRATVHGDTRRTARLRRDFGVFAHEGHAPLLGGTRAALRTGSSREAAGRRGGWHRGSPGRVRERRGRSPRDGHRAAHGPGHGGARAAVASTIASGHVPRPSTHRDPDVDGTMDGETRHPAARCLSAGRHSSADARRARRSRLLPEGRGGVSRRRGGHVEPGPATLVDPRSPPAPCRGADHASAAAFQRR
jgi:hypothetical protein